MGSPGGGGGLRCMQSTQKPESLTVAQKLKETLALQAVIRKQQIKRDAKQESVTQIHDVVQG